MAKELGTEKVHTFYPDEIDLGIEFLSQAEQLIGHNILMYDLPLIYRLTGIDLREYDIIDTMVVSSLLNPDRGGHSLEDWGNRLKGTQKVQHEDWSKFSQNMMTRCVSDVHLTEEVYNALEEEKKDGDWELALKIEHRVARIIAQQVLNGVGFDKEKAEQYVEDLTKERDQLYNHIRPMLSKEVEVYGSVPVNKPFKKSGDYSKMVVDWFNGDVPDVVGQFSRVNFVEPDLGSRQKLIKQLLKIGWRPLEYTEKGNPKLTEESLEFLEGVGNDIARWYILKHRQSQIEGWLNKLRPDGRLSAEAFTCGTNTGRFRHKIVVNVPKASPKVVFGKEMRSLFVADPPYIMVGHDAEQLELRMLAHYMGDDEYIRQILEGDIHTFNQNMAGLDNRDDAKTFIYAFNYGAGDAKLGSIVGGTAADGRVMRETFLARVPKLARLMKRVETAANRGYLIGLDGRKLWLRSQNKALNTLLQGGGAVVMKSSMIFLDKWVRRHNLDVRKVIDMHDEGQAEVLPDHVDMYKELAAKSIVKAGEYFNLRIPLAGDTKVGTNWSETH